MPFSVGVALAGTANTVLLVAVGTGGNFGALLPGLFLVVSSIGFVNTAGSSLALQDWGHVAGSASALLGLISMVLGAVAAPLAGIAGSNTALPIGLVIAVADVGAVALYAIWRWRQPGIRAGKSGG